MRRSRLKPLRSAILQEAHLSIIFGEDVSEADVLRLALENELRLSIHLLNATPTKRARILTKTELTNYPPLDYPDIVLSVQDDEIHFLTDTLDLPMIKEEKTVIERKFRQILGLPIHDQDVFDSVCVMHNSQLYELQEQFAYPLFIDINENASQAEVKQASAMQNYTYARDFPPDAILVVRTASLKELELAAMGAPVVVTASPLATTERNTLLTIIAALCDYSKIEHQGRGAAAQIARLTEASEARVSEDAVGKALKKIPNALESRMK